MKQDESLSSEGSSFTRELGRLHRAMSMATEKSLVILDEVGRECRSDGESSRCEVGQKGKAWSIEHPCDTSCADGAGLFIATIYDFLQRGSKCPIVITATHHLRKPSSTTYARNRRSLDV